MLIFDCEIEKAILGKNETPIDGVEYCDGWRDFKGMGISCICAYDTEAYRHRVFLKDNFGEFQALVYHHQVIAGFNNLAFDNKLCEAHGLNIPEEKTYDLLREIRKGLGLDPDNFDFKRHSGYTLDAMTKANGIARKTGNGALAPVQWQRGKFGEVIDYCMNDIGMTEELILKSQALGELASPHGKVMIPIEPIKAFCEECGEVVSELETICGMCDRCFGETTRERRSLK